MPGIQGQPSLDPLGLFPGARRCSWAVLLALALALASFMHVAHSHEVDTASIYKQHCAFCGALDRGTAPPPAAHVVLPAASPPAFDRAAAPAPRAGTDFRTACRPRAPPFLRA